jgi:uncharacterized protein YjbI with pentapeptide repeats
MADEEQVKRLKQGVPGWNAWWLANWRESRGAYVDLGGANLSRANLTGADLRQRS